MKIAKTVEWGNAMRNYKNIIVVILSVTLLFSIACKSNNIVMNIAVKDEDTDFIIVIPSYTTSVTQKAVSLITDAFKEKLNVTLPVVKDCYVEEDSVYKIIIAPKGHALVKDITDELENGEYMIEVTQKDQKKQIFIAYSGEEACQCAAIFFVREFINNKNASIPCELSVKKKKNTIEK